MLSALSTKLGEVLTDLLVELDERLMVALDSAMLEAVIAIPLQSSCVLCLGNWSDAGALGIEVSGSLAELLADEAVVSVDTSALEELPLGGVLGDLVVALTGGLTATVGGLVGTAVDDALRPLAQLPSSTTSLGVPIIELVTTVYRELYVNGVVSLMINAQNDPLIGHAEPPDWAGLPSMRFDVAALRIGVLGALAADEVRLYLGRGSVGEVCSPAGVAAGDCPGY